MASGNDKIKKIDAKIASAEKNAERKEEECERAVSIRQAPPGIEQGKRHSDRRRQDNSRSQRTQTNIHIHGNVKYMQVGRNNTMCIVNNSFAQARKTYSTRSQSNQKAIVDQSSLLTDAEQEKLKKLKEDTSELSQTMMQDLAKEICKRWRFYGRKLGFQEPELHEIHESTSDLDLRETVYVVLKRWKEREENPTLGKFVTILSKDEEVSVLKGILSRVMITNPGI